MSELLASVSAYLETNTLPYEVLACDPELADTKQFCEHYDIPFANSANAIIVKAKKGEPKYTLCVVLATHRLDVNHVVKAKLDAKKVSFASPDETLEITKMELGGVTPIGLAESVPVWVDSAVMQCEYIILGGGNRASKLKVAPDLLRQLPNVEIVERLANPV